MANIILGDYNSLPQQVQENKDNIKLLNDKDTNIDETIQEVKTDIQVNTNDITDIKAELAEIDPTLTNIANAISNINDVNEQQNIEIAKRMKYYGSYLPDNEGTYKIGAVVQLRGIRPQYYVDTSNNPILQPDEGDLAINVSSSGYWVKIAPYGISRYTKKYIVTGIFSGRIVAENGGIDINKDFVVICDTPTPSLVQVLETYLTPNSSAASIPIPYAMLDDGIPVVNCRFNYTVDPIFSRIGGIKVSNDGISFYDSGDVSGYAGYVSVYVSNSIEI